MNGKSSPDPVRGVILAACAVCNVLVVGSCVAQGQWFPVLLFSVVFAVNARQAVLDLFPPGARFRSAGRHASLQSPYDRHREAWIRTGDLDHLARMTECVRREHD